VRRANLLDAASTFTIDVASTAVVFLARAFRRLWITEFFIVAPLE
jgi:hypothetical protein